MFCDFSAYVFDHVKPRDEQEREAREREAVLAVTLKLIDQGVNVVRANGSGQKPRDVAEAVKEACGLVLTPQIVLDHLSALERAGKLTYEGADNSRRGLRAGFRRGPLVR